MSLSADQRARQRHEHLLRERCEAMGMLLWCPALSSANGIDGSLEPLARWMQSPLLGRLMPHCADRTEDPSDVRFHRIFKGCWALPMSEYDNAEWVRRFCVLALDPSVTESEEFHSICADADVEPAELQPYLAPFLQPRGNELGHLARVLTWCRDDLAEISGSQVDLASLTSQLSETYEQISAVYQIARAMNCVDDPQQFVMSTCRHVHLLLEFDWIAVLFVDSPLVIQSMHDQLVLAGEATFDRAAFSRTAMDLIQTWNCDQWTDMLRPEKDELASFVGSEVIIEPIAHDDSIIGALIAGNKNGPDPEVSSVDTQLLDSVSGFLSVFNQNVVRYEVQRTLFMGSVRAMASAIDAKDPYTRGHSERVARLARQLALASGMDEEAAERVYISGVVHDVGKIGVPEAVLCKPGKLSDDDWTHIKRHPEIGYGILRDIPPMADMLPGVLHHHERWDGQGYPHGLAGTDIPQLGRLLAVCDAFDAMSSDRAYRSRLSREKVLSILRDGAGTQWDAEYVATFLKLDLAEYDQLIAQSLSQSSQRAA